MVLVFSLYVKLSTLTWAYVSWIALKHTAHCTMLGELLVSGVPYRMAPATFAKFGGLPNTEQRTIASSGPLASGFVHTR